MTTAKVDELAAFRARVNELPRLRFRVDVPVPVETLRMAIADLALSAGYVERSAGAAEEWPS